MISDKKTMEKYYEALVNKDAQFDGIFYVGVKTTGVFCHPTCSARKPKYENCLFYQEAEEALLSGFRPCKICNPLSYPQEISPLIKTMITMVEAHPEKRWKDEDFATLGVHAATARRQFKKYFNMTFVQYARARRMGIALKSIRIGHKIIESQHAIGYDSSSGFADAFSKIMGASTTKNKRNAKILYADWLDTPLGPMLSVTDEAYLYLLEFVNRRGLEKEIERLRKRLQVSIMPGTTAISEQIKQELDQYFNDTLSDFKTPLYLMGSDFQKSVWELLRKIPMGETCSYKDLAKELNNPKAIRAVGNANGANQLAIIIPCHRVIQTNGSLGGYGGGLERKSWLLAHEQRHKQKNE